MRNDSQHNLESGTRQPFALGAFTNRAYLVDRTLCHSLPRTGDLHTLVGLETYRAKEKRSS